MRKVLKVVLINVAVLALLLVIVEIVLRIFGIGYGNAPFENDEVLHHVHPANYSFLSYVPSKEFGGHQIRYNSDRYRVNEDQDEREKTKTIWFLGDSYTEALQVSWNNTFVGKSQLLLNNEYSVFNFGVSSYSPLLYVIQLRKILSSYKKPEMVFIQLYGNDVREDNEYEKAAKFNEKDEPLLCNGGNSTGILYKVIRSLYIARSVRKVQRTLEYKNEQLKNPAENSVLQFEDYVEDEPEIIESSRFAKSIFQVDSLLNAQGIPHYFFSIPSKYSCTTGKWDVESFSTRFAAFARLKNLPFISLDKAFQEASKSQKVFYDEDIHCNEKGNELIAQGIWRAVKKVGS